MLGSLKFNAPKCETNARLCVARIRLLKNKKNMQMRAYRKDIADLLKAGKLDYAIIRVESVIREQLTLTAYEILELYLELVSVRATMIAQSKTIPGDMMEALSSVLYASSRCPDLEELTKLRAMFEQKYGKEYVGAALSDRDCHRFSVNERLIRCLTVEPPPPDMKLQSLSEIAQEYGVEWDAAEGRRVLLGDTSGVLYNPMGSTSAAAAAAAAPAPGNPMTGLVLRPSDDTLDIMGPPQPQQQQQYQQQQQQGDGGYADVAAAAQAAAAAAQQAQAAADAAARMAAAGRGGGTPGGPGPAGGAGGGGGGGSGGTPAPIRPPGPPAQGWLADMENFQHIQAPSPGPSAAAARPAAAGNSAGSSSLAPSAAAAAAAAGSSAAAAASGFKVPSAEEIQRAYDAAQGPPPKPHLAGGSGAAPVSEGQGRMAPPPAAPPVKASEEDISGVAPAPADNSGSGGLGELPSVPGRHGGSGGGAPPSDFDELQKRFEALKKS